MHFLCTVKVLILHQHFKTPYKGGAIRSYYLAKALVDRGINVEVITGHGEKERKEIIEGITIHYLKVPYDNNYGFGKRIFSFLQFVYKAKRKIKRLSRFDLCYAISVPLTVGLVALWTRRKRAIPYVFEVGDLWPEAPIQMGVISNGVVKKLLYALEKKIYASAQSIVALSPAIKASIEITVPKKKVTLLPNMSDTEFFGKSVKGLAIENKYGVKGKFVVSYLGAIGEANGLDYFIEIANISRKAELPVHFIICGEGAHKPRLVKLVETLMLKNITILDFTNRDGVKEILNITDACFISYKPVPILETGSPNKYFDALASGKLVIINFGGWIRSEIEKDQCGIFVDPYQPYEFTTKIRAFIEDPGKLEDYQSRARSLAERKYSREELGERFYRVITERAE